MASLGDLDLHGDHPLAMELSSLRKSVRQFQEEVYSSSAKLQGDTVALERSQERVTHLEQENASLKWELSILRQNPHPDSAPQAHPAITQVQQLTLSLRRLSDKFTLTENALLERTTQLAVATSDIAKAKLAVESAYELAARTRGREEEGKSRELALEMKLRAAEEAANMSDVVVQEYAALVRSLEAKSSPRQNGHSRSVSSPGGSATPALLKDGLAEGKLGLQRLVAEFSAATGQLQAELFTAQGEIAVLKSKDEVEKKNLDQHLVELARARFDLERLKVDDNSAAKMVSRYMKFSQQSTDTLQEALKTLAIRHKATLDTLHDRVSLLSAQVQFYEARIKDISQMMEELSVDLMKESYGRRREIALRLRMVNREERLSEDLGRWVLRAEEGLARDTDSSLSILEKMLTDARTFLSEILGGVSKDSSGPLARSIVVQNAFDTLALELEREKAQRLEYEKACALSQLAFSKKVADVPASEPIKPSAGSSLSVTANEQQPSPATNSTSSPSQPIPAAIESSLHDQLLLPSISQPITDNNPGPVAVDNVADSAAGERSGISPVNPLPLSRPSSPREINGKDLGSGTPAEPASFIPQDKVIELEKLGDSSGDQPPSLPNAEDTCSKVEKVFSPVTRPEALVGEKVNSGHIATDSIMTPGTEHTGPMPNQRSSKTETSSKEAEKTLISVTGPKAPGTAEDDDSTRSIMTPDNEHAGAITNQHRIKADSRSLIDEKSDPSLAGPTLDGSLPPSSLSPNLDKSLPPTHNPTTDLLSPTPRTPHPLLAELERAKHRYDDLHQAFRDCYLALERLKENILPTVDASSPGFPEGPISNDILRTAVRHLTDYTEDARVELEIQTADEELMARGFETLLSIPGALSSVTPLLSSPSLSYGNDHDKMPSQSEVESQIETFVSGEDPGIQKAHRTFSRKLEDIQHDIAALKRAAHDVVMGETVETAPVAGAVEDNTGEGSSWVSWVRSPSTPSNLGSAILGTPTFGNVITSPRLRHSSSVNFPTHSLPGRRVFSQPLGAASASSGDPLASLGLKVPMPKFVSRQSSMAYPYVPRTRTVSAMYMLGLGARSPSSAFSGSPVSLQKQERRAEPPPRLRLDGMESEGEADDEDGNGGVE